MPPKGSSNVEVHRLVVKGSRTIHPMFLVYNIEKTARLITNHYLPPGTATRWYMNMADGPYLPLKTKLLLSFLFIKFVQTAG
jgi:hypothetical protein